MTNLMKRILIVLPEPPFPLRAQGISIRYFPIIQHLFKKATIDIVLISNSTCDIDCQKNIKHYCEDIIHIKRPTNDNVNIIRKTLKRIGFFLPWTLPRSWTDYDNRATINELHDFIKNKFYSCVICVSGYNYPYIMSISAHKTIVDFIDSPSVLSDRNVIGSNRSILIRKYEAWKTARWEAKIIKQTDSSIYISNHDASYVASDKASVNKRYVIPNGFSVDDFTFECIDTSTNKPSIGFLGNMSYYPNVEAVIWLYHEVFLKIKQTIPDLTLYIIGRSPDSSLLKLVGDDVIVTGDVDNIWPYVNKVDIFVFPILRGAGMKNKILEAMYAEKPVITSSIGNEGIDAVNHEQLIICKSGDDYIKSIINLFENPKLRQSIGHNASKYAKEKFNWDTILKELDKIIP